MLARRESCVTVSDFQISRGLAGARLPVALPDGIQWPLTMSVLAYGVRIGIRANDPSVAEELAGHLPPDSKYNEYSDVGRVYSLVFEKDDRSGRQQNSVYVDGALLARRSTLQAALRIFEADVQLYVAEMAPDRVFVHAGVVGCRGRAILLPGRSFTGKSTLVAELIRAGAEYYSDEYAVLDSAGERASLRTAASYPTGGSSGRDEASGPHLRRACRKSPASCRVGGGEPVSIGRRMAAAALIAR